MNVDTLSGLQLARYAKDVGVPMRDIEHLSEDRLRQNCKLTVARLFELLDD